MIQFFWRRWLGFDTPGTSDDDAFDPLRHPALQRMSLRELADLPLRPHLCPDRREG